VLSAEDVAEEMEILSTELRITMFCSGAGDLAALRQPGVLVKVEG
jgi:isopentenyl diphosphate isomerase/L-lactate dehydrogenase-like FMN-dependent dehydrogenase